MSLEAYLEKSRQKVDQFLDQYCKVPEPDFGQLHEAMRYSLMVGGKRVRPALMFAAFDACVDSLKNTPELNESVIRLASSLEMIHTYSLIHDDLPAMDNDDLRRGKPTNHKVFGESCAILAGDSLLTEAFSVIAHTKGISSSVLLELVADIADASGARGMAGGQALDLVAEGKVLTPQELERVHRHKTGCLIQVAVTTGAKLALVNPEILEKMKIYGHSVGLAFQIADDILDVESSSEKLGKTAGADLINQKATYPSIMGLEASKKLARDLADKAFQALSSFDQKADVLRQMAEFIIFRKN